MVDPTLVDPEITVAEVDGGTTVVSVHGELDVGSADEFRAALGGRTGDSPAALVIDLVGTTFIDSIALGIIVGAAKMLKRTGGTLTVVATDPRILRIFKLTGLHRTVRVEQSLAQALAYTLA
jgi:anti-sigma B factor antagonist